MDRRVRKATMKYGSISTGWRGFCECCCKSRWVRMYILATGDTANICKKCRTGGKDQKVEKDV